MHILGQNKVLRHGPLRVWAERGLVRVEDSRDNSFTTLTVKQTAERAKGLSDMIRNSTSTNNYFNYQQVVELQRLLEGYVDIMRQAQEQGMPDDPTAVRDLSRRRSAKVSMTANINTNMNLEF